MNDLHLVIAIQVIAVLLIIILIFLIVREIISTTTKLTNGTVSPEPVRPSAIIQLTNTPISDFEGPKEHEPEPQAKEPLCPAEHDIELIEEPQTNETISLTQTNKYRNLPQDSMLRRHYLTNLRGMIEFLKAPRPIDSALSRHYDSIISAEIEQCLSDQGSLERLIINYESHKKTLVQQIQEPVTIAESNMPPRPTDSVLRRHYDTMVKED